jgi:hypothetical protein
MVDRKDVGVGRIQAKWEIWEAEYKKAKTFLEDVHAFVTKSKQFAFEDKEACALLTKFHAFDSKILSESKRLKEVINLQSALKYFLAGDGNGGKIVTSNPRFKAHFVMMMTKSTSLTIEKCLICDYFYDHHEIVVASYACTYHPWCLGFHIPQSRTCAKENVWQTFPSYVV